MKDLVVYPQELKDLGEAIKINSISMASAITKTEFDVAKLPELQKAIASANPNQPDLFYRHAILSSIGWNANDDIFLKEPSWAAKSSPRDKQLNFMHDDSYIIGHMTDNFALAEDGSLLDNELTGDQIPDKFDIGVAFVLYTALANEERRNQVEEIIAGIDSGEWFVSMECRFPHFDYAIADTQGNQKIIPRNKDSAFLTKHLAAYGGTGQYQGQKLGRVLKDFVFSGIGIVKNPANKRSVIYNANAYKTFSSQGSLEIRDTKMDEEIKQLKSELAVAKAAVENQNKAVAEATKAEIDGLKAQVTTLTENVAKAEKASKDKDEEVKSAKAEVEALKAAKAEVDTALAAEKKKNEDNQKEKAKAERIAKLVEVGVAKADAETIYTTWAEVNDAQFADIVKLNTKATAEEKKVDGKVVETTTASVTDAKADKNPTFVQATEGAKAEQVKSLTSWLTSVASKNTKNKKEQE